MVQGKKSALASSDSAELAFGLMKDSCLFGHLITGMKSIAGMIAGFCFKTRLA